MKLKEKLAKQRSNIENLAVVITCKCQMQCVYCHQDRTRPDMSKEELFGSIDLLFTSPSNEVELQFFGGEPLLRFDLVKKGIEYARKKEKETGKNIHYLITTNGLLLDSQKLEYLKMKQATIMLSVDGGCSTHIKNRPLSGQKPNDYFERVCSLLKLLNDTKSDYFVNAVFLPQDIKNLVSNANYLIDAGVKDIEFAYAFGVRFKNNDIDACVKEFNKLKELARKRKVKIRNIYTNKEPVFLSAQIMVTAEGTIYVGCALLLEKLFPEFNRLFFSGNLQEVTDIIVLRRSKRQQLDFIFKNINSLNKELLSNLYLGVALEVFAKANDFVGKYLSIANHKPELTENYLYRDKMLLMLTYNCQMDCRYCYMSRNCPDMPVNILYKSIDLLFTSPSKEIEFQFFGGEPLLRFDLVKKGIKYAEKKKKATGKKVKYLITTNGLSINNKVLDFLLDYDAYFLLSIDGEEKTQRLNRPFIGKKKAYSFARLKEKITLLTKRNCNYFVNFVIGPQNIHCLPENIQFFLKQEVKKLRFSYELGTFWNQEKILDYFNSVFKVMLELPVSSNCFVINAEADDEPYLISPVLTVDYNGKVYSGCTLPLEKRLPALKAVNFIGGIDKIDTITQVQRSRQENAHRVINSYLPKSAPRRLILNNLIMGEISETFFREFWTRQVPREK